MAGRRYHNYIFLAENDSHIRQWHFSRGKLFAMIGLSIILVGAILFFSAEVLTQFIYQNKLQKIRNNYTSLSSTIIELHSRLDQMGTQMENIEEKDIAVRSYANLPQVDRGIRELGIGGIRLENSTAMEELVPEVETKIAELEMDIDHLSRKVKLELSSYANIYDKVKKDSKRMQFVPSLRPVLGGYLNSGFGYRRDPMDGQKRFHYGQDITIPTGSFVFAPADGVVQDARYRGGFGKCIKINHGYGYSTIYAHLSHINVKKGDRIKRGSIIAQTGNSGRSTAPHLHYEVHYYGTSQDPLNYFFSGYLK